MSKINLIRECVKIINSILPTKEENVNILIRGDLFNLAEIFKFCGQIVLNYDSDPYVTLSDIQIALGFRKTYISNNLILKYGLLGTSSILKNDTVGRPPNLYNTGDVNDLLIFLTFYKAYRLIKDGVRIHKLVLPSPRHNCFKDFVKEFNKISHLFSSNITRYLDMISNVTSLRELNRNNKENN